MDPTASVLPTTPQRLTNICAVVEVILCSYKLHFIDLITLNQAELTLLGRLLNHFL